MSAVTTRLVCAICARATTVTSEPAPHGTTIARQQGWHHLDAAGRCSSTEVTCARCAGTDPAHSFDLMALDSRLDQ